MDNKELGNMAVCMEGYAWKGRKELDTPTPSTQAHQAALAYQHRHSQSKTEHPRQQ